MVESQNRSVYALRRKLEIFLVLLHADESSIRVQLCWREHPPSANPLRASNYSMKKPTELKLYATRDRDAVVVGVSRCDIGECPAGRSNTLSGALRSFANEIEEYNLNLTPEQFMLPRRELRNYIRGHVHEVNQERIKAPKAERRSA
jgi:hypothetical protein